MTTALQELLGTENPTEILKLINLLVAQKSNIDLSNLSSTGQAKFDDLQDGIDTKVSKTGDTMTGDLTIANSTTGVFQRNTSVTKGTNPSSNKYWEWRADDSNLNPTEWYSNRMGHFLTTLFPNGTVTTEMKAFQNDPTASASADFKLSITSSGVKSCEFPNTKCCDGQWAVSGTNVADNVSLPIGIDQRLEYNISSILPNDGYNYMVLISVDIETGSGSGASVVSSVIGKDYNGNDVWTRVSNLTARGSWIMTGASNVIIPVNSSRKIWLNYSVYSKIAKLNSLFLEAFRRTGTNG